MYRRQALRHKTPPRAGSCEGRAGRVTYSGGGSERSAELAEAGHVDAGFRLAARHFDAAANQGRAAATGRAVLALHLATEAAGADFDGDAARERAVVEVGHGDVLLAGGDALASGGHAAGVGHVAACVDLAGVG